VNKRTLLNLLKYGLAIGMMVYVVWSNWGDARGTAGKIIVGAADGDGDVSGQVVAYSPDESITIQEKEPFGQKKDPIELALKPKGKTEVVGPGDTPLPEGETIAPGKTVTAASISRGLAYVW